LQAKKFPEGMGLNIRWLGPTFIPQDFMTAADVLVLPSYREGFGTVLIEAAACGLPTVAYKIDGVVDAIEDGRTGLLCEVGNITALSACMYSLFINKEYRSQLGAYGLKNVQERFSSTAITQAWIDFYLQLSNFVVFHPKPLKRIFDLLLAVLIVPFMVTPIAIISIGIWISSGLPILHWSERVGRSNRLFLMPKFRSMTVNAPVVATHLLVSPEAHITVIGKFLRKSSLDELPQIWSILKGDMSFVGPRPALFNQQDLIDQRKILGIDQLRPGLTGWAQVNGRDDIPLEKKIQLDAQYLERQSFRFDLHILWLTFLKVIRSDGVSH
jgi:O-antigen biosynthesis protein WbqP